MAPCIVFDVYKAPGSNITPQEFSRHVAQVHRVWGDQCSFDIRWRFQDSQGRPRLQDIGGPIVTHGLIPDGLIPPEALPFAPPELFEGPPNVLVCGDYNALPDNVLNPGSDPSYIKQWLNYRPGIPFDPNIPQSRFGQTRPLDIAVYYVQGPLLGDGSLGCGGYYTPSGPAIVIANNLPTINVPNVGEFTFPRTDLILAHEFGHILLQGLPEAGHVDDVNNIMFRGLLTANSFRVTPDQCNEARKSQYFQEC
ncbi:hypothetical protein ACIQ4Z_22505 [Peribacillus asahii]|uniref:hypothetical protein n=1 Tax=Peribacillus asahii TaxID=228899 RepID=UPI0037FC2646